MLSVFDCGIWNNIYQTNINMLNEMSLNNLITSYMNYLSSVCDLFIAHVNVCK